MKLDKTNGIKSSILRKKPTPRDQSNQDKLEERRIPALKYLRIYYQNLSGSKTKLGLLNDFFSSANYDIALIQETWFNCSINNDAITHNTNYSIIRNDCDLSVSKKRDGGGVAMLISNDRQFERIQIQEFKIAENIAVAVTIRSIMGDFNSPALEWEYDDHQPGTLSCANINLYTAESKLDAFAAQQRLFQINPNTNERGVFLDSCFSTKFENFKVLRPTPNDLIEPESTSHYAIEVILHYKGTSNTMVEV